MCTLIENSNNTEQNETANFETAISATKFGKYNYLLILFSIFGAMIPMNDIAVMSYVIPAAQCDLDLSLQKKGQLNSAVFIGFIICSYFWGFFADTLGRKRILLACYTLDLIFNVLGAFMHNFWSVYIFKLLTGFVTCGAYALILTYMSEFHSTEYRSQIIVMVGIFMIGSNIVLPLLAWVVMPLADISILSYVLHPWQLFWLISAIPVFISIVVFTFLPETPKYLMSSGQNEKAMKLFKRMYSWNTGNPEADYPIKHLNDETQTSNAVHVNQNINITSLSNKNTFKLLQTGLKQVKPLFHQPHVLNIFLFTVINIGILLGDSTLRLWLPQIFTYIDEFNQIQGIENGTLCEVIDYFFQRNVTGLNVTETGETDCYIILPNDQVYLNSLIVTIACLIGNIVVIPIINRFRRKYLLVCTMTLSGCAVLGIYWTPNQLTMLVVTTININFIVISWNILFCLVVELFPTSLRGVAVSLTLMSGQVGALAGNIMFPYLLQAGCLPPFLFLGCTIISCGLLSMALPNPSAEDFK